MNLRRQLPDIAWAGLGIAFLIWVVIPTGHLIYLAWGKP